MINKDKNKKTILIVEDEPSMSMALKEKLNREGFNTLQAPDGEEALALVNEHLIDLILLDIVMPKMDGNVFISKLNNLGKGNIPVIIITNLTSVAVQNSVKEVIIKSNISLEEITKKIKTYLGMDIVSV